MSYSSLGLFDLWGEPGRFTDGAGDVGDGAGFFESLLEGVVYVFDCLVDIVGVGYVGVV